MRYYLLFLFIISLNFYAYGKNDNFLIENIETQTKAQFFNNKIQMAYLNLDEDEKKYLEEKKELKLCINPNWFPLEKIENGEHIGISSEFINLISEKIKIPVKLVETKSWEESLSKIKKRECDILFSYLRKPFRKKIS